MNPFRFAHTVAGSLLCMIIGHNWHLTDTARFGTFRSCTRCGEAGWEL